jgi:hypothetical protein
MNAVSSSEKPSSERADAVVNQADRRFFLQALYPHARLLRLAVLFSDHRHFDADYDLVSSLATVRDRRDLDIELTRFRYHPLNRGWLRRTLRLRISTRRLRHLASARRTSNPL